MSKINIIYLPDQYFGITAPHLGPVMNLYFEFSAYDSSKTYDKTNTLFIMNTFTDKEWGENLRNNGYTVVLDNLFERLTTTDFYTLSNKNWFWYTESLWYRSLGYHNYEPSRTYEKHALMLIRRQKNFRNALVNKLAPYLDNFLYSYVERGIFLDGETVDNNDIFQRNFVPAWYDKTCFSFIVETTIEGTGFITEKTFKPLAFKHPFIVFGQAGTLKQLNELGFETYNNMFDESYDSMISSYVRSAKLIDIVKNYNNIPYDSLTLEKIEHNYNLFYNQNLVTDKIKKEIIEPLIEYAESK